MEASYFGFRRLSGKQVRGVAGNTIVFGIFNRNGKVYTKMVPDTRKKTLQGIIRGKVALESVIHSDVRGGYYGLIRAMTTITGAS